MTKSFRTSLIALSIAALPFAGHAAGLGQINVFSGLGQPLRAEIQVSATAEELQSLSARIASPDAFRQANLSYGSVVSAIRVSVDTRAARPVIRLSSDRPVNEPFVDLLVELNWASGRLVREYTFLLDPVDIAAPRPLAAAVDTPAAAPAPRAAPAQPAPQRAAPAVRAAPETYTVRRGDTMHRIASAHVQPGSTLDQMLVALLRANPQAFDGGNINRLRAGAVLNVPRADAVRAIDPAEARREIRAQAADFDAYRRGLASSATARAPVVAAQAEQESAGRIVPRVEESERPEAAGDQVRVSRSEAAAADGSAEARLQVLEEELTSREKSLEEANARLAQLERSIRDLQRLLELQSGTMGQLQERAAAEPPVESDSATAAAQPEAQAAAEPVTEPAPAAPGAGVAAPADEAVAEPPAAAAPAAPMAAEIQPAAPAAPPAAPPPMPAASVAPAAEPSFVESLLEDPTLVAAGGGVLALLLALLALKARQRRKEAEIQAATAELEAGSLGGNSQAVFGGTGGQSVDTGATSIMHTDFSQSGLSSIDTDEGVDPVAEADVYMAYGRDAQAEEILLDALKADPARAAIKLKLLEIYAQRRNSRQFETIASELFALTGGHGRDWEKAATMGRKLEPENPLYKGEQTEIGGSATASVPPARDAGPARGRDATLAA
ncbi:FimV/HubP family polar landmark protein, partial [Thauera sp.]|uniref:type IV pilus assembly protein FimV n=1 Tax=Thauera sp. TaxID=1905334 RepID=UPI002CB13C5C